MNAKEARQKSYDGLAKCANEAMSTMADLWNKQIDVAIGEATEQGKLEIETENMLPQHLTESVKLAWGSLATDLRDRGFQVSTMDFAHVNAEHCFRMFISWKELEAKPS